MSALLIDDAGNVWPAQPETFTRRFGICRRRDFVQRAVDLGFIFITFGASGLHVALRPHLASRSAISRLFDIIFEQNPPRVALAHDTRLSAWELIIGGDPAIARIAQLVGEARSPLPRPLLTAQRLPLERCLDIAGAQLLPVLQAWQQWHGRWESDFNGRLLGWGLLRHTVITQQSRGSERLLIRHWGTHTRAFGKDWPRIAPGRDIEDQPNVEIGRWRGMILRQTIAEGVPRLAALDIVLRRVDRELIRLKYFQLALPWRTSDGTMLVTGTNVARRTIVLERPGPAN